MKRFVKLNILEHDWEFRFVPKDVLKKELGFDALGFTFVDKFTIDIVDTCSRQETKRILAHEITHAILCSQGRAFQKKLTQEEVCEYVAWTFELTNKLVSSVLIKVFGEGEQKICSH